MFSNSFKIIFADVIYCNTLFFFYSKQFDFFTLPNTFFNIRLSPVELMTMSVDEIHSTIINLVAESANPALTGVCCINMDDKVTDDKIDAVFEAVGQINGG